MWLPMRPHRPEGGSDRDRHPKGQDRLRAWSPKAIEPGRASGSPTNACKRRRSIFVETLPVSGTRHGSAPRSPGCGKGGRSPRWQGAGGLRGRARTSRHGWRKRRVGAPARSRYSACCRHRRVNGARPAQPDALAPLDPAAARRRSCCRGRSIPVDRRTGTNRHNGKVWTSRMRGSE